MGEKMSLNILLIVWIFCFETFVAYSQSNESSPRGEQKQHYMDDPTKAFTRDYGRTLFDAVVPEKWVHIPCEQKHPRCCELERLCPSNSRNSRIMDKYSTHADKLTLGVSRKYNGYAMWNCGQERDNWILFTKQHHRKIATNMIRYIGVQKDQFLLDWGAGCGTKLRVFEQRYGGISSGFGIDISEVSVWFANRVPGTKSCYCHADGAALSWIPADTFDHIVSFGSMYHLFNATDDQQFPPDLIAYDPTICNTLVQLFRLVKPGGSIMIDGNLHAPPMEYYAQCNNQTLIPRFGNTNLRIILDSRLHVNIRKAPYWSGAWTRGLRPVYAAVFTRPEKIP